MAGNRSPMRALHHRHCRGHRLDHQRCINIATELDRQRCEPGPQHRRPTHKTPNPITSGRVRHINTSRRRAHTRHALSHRFEHDTHALDHVETAHQQERRDQRMRHRTRRATRPSEPQPSTPAINTNRPSIPRPPTHRHTTRRAQRPRDYHRPASGDIGVDRKRTRPYDGHGWLRTLRTPPRRASTRRPGRGPSRLQEPPHPHRHTLSSPKSTAETNPPLLTQSGRQQPVTAGGRPGRRSGKGLRTNRAKRHRYARYVHGNANQPLQDQSRG